MLRLFALVALSQKSDFGRLHFWRFLHPPSGQPARRSRLGYLITQSPALARKILTNLRTHAQGLFGRSHCLCDRVPRIFPLSRVRARSPLATSGVIMSQGAFLCSMSAQGHPLPLVVRCRESPLCLPPVLPLPSWFLRRLGPPGLLPGGGAGGWLWSFGLHRCGVCWVQ